MFAKLTVGKRLFSLVVLAILLPVSLAIESYFDLSTLNSSLKTIYEDRVITLAQLAQIDNLMQSNRKLLNDLYIEKSNIDKTPHPDKSSKISRDIDENLQSIDQTTKEYLASYLESEERTLADEFAQSQSKYIVESLRPTLVALQGGQLATALKHLQQDNALYDIASGNLAELKLRQVNDTKDEVMSAQGTLKRSLLIALLLLVAVGGWLFVLERKISRAILAVLGGEPEEIKQTAQRIASGQINFELPMAKDDRDSVMAAIFAMKGNIKRLAGDIQSLATATAEGKVDARIDPALYVGEYRAVVEDVNKSMGFVNQTLNTVIEKNIEAAHAKQIETERILSQSVEEVQHVVLAAKANDLSQRISLHGKQSEIASLCGGVNELIENVVNILSQIREAGITVKIASQEISNGNSELAQRTEAQAASLEETASSMEELSATVKQTADNAKQAEQLAVTASTVASKGGDVVAKVALSMDSVKESAKKIEDIMSLIDEIAFQTNILALNAAVEAARAGEHGRGFAVVATEVRSLAQRSAFAAKEVKVLIGDSIFKTVEGNKQVEIARSTMEEIVASFKQVANIIAEISNASGEQSVGIDQVNRAITHLDGMTQQNASLVAEAASSSDLLFEQANRLTDSISRFKLGNDTSDAALVPHQLTHLHGNEHNTTAHAMASHSAAERAEWEEF